MISSVHTSPLPVNPKQLRIVVTSSEAAPFSKSGGLADVTPALCKSLDSLGHNVTMVIPYHQQTPQDTGVSFSIAAQQRKVTASVYWSTLPDSRVRVLLIGQPYFFDRPGLYQHPGGDYDDNCERFCFFSRAVVECCRRLVLQPDIIHVNDWQTALIPALLEIERRDDPAFVSTASVLTIHNLAFQGAFGHDAMPITGLDWKYYNYRQLEALGGLNLLKGGIAFANKLTTVSPTYAQEIQGPDAGCALDAALRFRNEDLSGILNGVDPITWNPATDPHIAVNFDATSVETGKPLCKAALQARMGLPAKPNVPLFSVISRMTDQKGFDLIAATADQMLENDIQLVVLGTGESRYETMFRELMERYPDKVAAHIGFDESLAHQIEAGSDVFLMPSRFEPCGLNQMYSLAYGTIPLVRKVGGLADSVVNATSRTLADDTATGIVFTNYESADYFDAFERSLQLYLDTATRRQVVRCGMSGDLSWSQSSQKYVDVYHSAMAAIRPTAAATDESAVDASAKTQQPISAQTS
ncbi:UNVERIFIED_CONTAM: hypothetical protein GTU68_006466 [Idotea baltica]|nr:hypothetical protein [Idotea baltica]